MAQPQSNLSASQKELFRLLHEKYGLNEDHYFTNNHYTIVKRTGIDMIQSQLPHVKISYSLEHFTENHKYVVMRANCFVTNPDGTTYTYETFGEVNPENVTSGSGKYPFAMAQKRANSRAVLYIAGLYQLGAFGEEEMDNNDFKKEQEPAKKESSYNWRSEKNKFN